MIQLDHIDRELDAGLIIFLSRHSSERPQPILTVHATGNLGPATLGGVPGSLPVASPEWMHSVLSNLKRYAPAGYRVAYEVTHHGPTELSTPSFFAEVGSTAAEWEDRSAGYAVAMSLLQADPKDTLNLIGIGGTHYARRETEISLHSRAAFGHIVHSRFASSLTPGVLGSLARRGAAHAAYLDRKALGSGEATRIAAWLSDLGIPLLSEHELLQFQHLSRTTWEGVRKMAREVSPMVTLTISPAMRDGTPRLLRLPDDLVGEAARIDPGGLKEGIGRLPLASLSSGGDPVLPVFITTEEEGSALLNDLISLCVALLCSGETTAVEGDRLTISRTRFDPEKARILGIPRGPLFGELMKGRAVNVNGREITPDMVRTRTVKCIRIPGLEKLI